MELLDPKLDVVFKMLFADPRNRGLLISLISAVLRPPSPIVRLEVLNPELPKDLVSDRGVHLDVLVELEDGQQVDVEMECDARRAHGARWLYHWARLFGARLRRGDAYSELEPVVCVVFLDAHSADRFHSLYEVREAHDGERLSDVLSVHVVDLPKLERALPEHETTQLLRWARFLRADDAQTLDLLAQEDPIMAEAKHALEILSREPSAQQIAEMRREAEVMNRIDRAEARKEGREEGDRVATRRAIDKFCATADIVVDDARRAWLDGLTIEQLDATLETLFATRRFP